MKLSIDDAQIFVPDGLPTEDALKRTTHMGIGAHHDDLEIMAIDGILKCYQRSDRWFTGVVVSDGRGPSRAGLYADYNDEQMQAVREQEQIKAAFMGEYAAQALLKHPSARVKAPDGAEVTADIAALLHVARPEVVYTHNLADKHSTHIGVVTRTIQAIRSLPLEERPQQLYGCEVWRDLDWMLDTEKVVFDTSEREALQMALVGVFDSQVTGGKRYDLATMGRRRANVTYFDSHASDTMTGALFAMNLTPLIQDDSLSIRDFALSAVQRFMDDVRQRIDSVL